MNLNVKQVHNFFCHLNHLKLDLRLQAVRQEIQLCCDKSHINRTPQRSRKFRKVDHQIPVWLKIYLVLCLTYFFGLYQKPVEGFKISNHLISNKLIFPVKISIQHHKFISSWFMIIIIFFKFPTLRYVPWSGTAPAQFLLRSRRE